MRILHTADWHLGSRLHGYDRADDLFRQVERVLELADQHRVDVLLVAGDVFDHRTLPELTKRLAELLRPRVQRGLHVLLVPGNHDNREHFRMMRALLSLQEDGQRLSRVHVVQTRDVVEIDGVQFAVIPYPTRELLEPGRIAASGTTERNVALSTSYAGLVRTLVATLDPGTPSVFVGHITVAGVTTPGDRELTYDEDIRLGTADLPLGPNLRYVAFGHIHQPQPMRHPIPCWYAGSIDRLNLGERDDEKCVLLVDIDGDGPATVTPLPLEATPFYDIHVAGSALETLPQQYKDLDRAFVRITIDCANGGEPVALQRRARELCPRCLEVNFTGDTLGPTPTAGPEQPRDYATTVLDFMREQFKDDPDLPELERRTRELLEEVNNVVAAY